MLPPNTNTPDKESPRNATNPLFHQSHVSDSTQELLENPEVLLRHLQETIDRINSIALNDPSSIEAWVVSPGQMDTSTHQSHIEHLKEIIEDALRITEDWSDMKD
jgi:hypothetical protein